MELAGRKIRRKEEHFHLRKERSPRSIIVETLESRTYSIKGKMKKGDAVV